jgi:hypothetical protein
MTILIDLADILTYTAPHFKKIKDSLKATIILSIPVLPNTVEIRINKSKTWLI